MKHGKRPTIKQMKVLQANKMDVSMWLVSRVLPDRLDCVHRYTGQLKPAFYKVLVV